MIDKNTVQNIARLARLHLEEAEIPQYTQQLGDILKYIDQLSELKTDQVEPMSHAVESATPMAADKAESSALIEKVLKEAPAAEGPFFQVPKVL